MARVTNDDIIKYKNEEIERLEKEIKNLKEIIDVKTKDYNDLVDENEELKDELWVRKHCVSKLRKDKELYEKAREVMFWKEEEDLYEDVK